MKNIKIQLLNLFLPILSILFVLYLQFFKDVNPCSLCLLQRWGMYLSIFFICLSLFFNFIKKIKSSIFFLTLSVLSNIFSLIISIRNVWLQTLPEDKIPACGLDIESLLKIVSPLTALKKTFIGSGDCAQKSWVFLGQSLAVWALIFFTLFLIYQIMVIYKINNKNV